MPAKKAKTVGFSDLERSILKAKGVGDDGIGRMEKAGIRSREDFRVVGDAATLAETAGLDPEAAARVMGWALGLGAVAPGPGPSIVVESGDVVTCVSCGKRQPKDYKAGDLCVHCAKQAEPTATCFWCTSSGPGQFCRRCGARFVPPGELELALLLKRDGLPKDEIPGRLAGMSAKEKDGLWGRVRAGR